MITEVLICISGSAVAREVQHKNELQSDPLVRWQISLLELLDLKKHSFTNFVPGY